MKKKEIEGRSNFAHSFPLSQNPLCSQKAKTLTIATTPSPLAALSPPPSLPPLLLQRDLLQRRR
ncbi:hypothetical protein RchiOBHm_Chr5g0080191 [Rosa chinensis]|uniref:Uncharacterized protein n=1 Tax=Rosa chinensis TaxID=74649 RepID=A0A2P6QMN8_ROSCH|nr:hypothetical protein RchiOBHm_Chr5g0080191 [Rosa chinensis]